MIVTTTYTAESKKETKALRMMALNLQEAGLNIQFVEPGPDGSDARIMLSESRRSRRSSQQVAEDALLRGEAHP